MAYRRKSRSRRVSNPGPSKAETEKLVHAYAVYSRLPRYGVSRKVQEKLYAQYERALNRVLDKLGARTLSAENEAGLQLAADQWWNSRAMRGAGVDW